MTHNDWEAGTIKLPTTEFARVRKALQDADAAHKEAVFAQTQEIWKGLTRKQQADPVEYRRAVQASVELKQRASETYRFGRPSTGVSNEVLDGVETEMQRRVWSRDSSPRRVVRSDMDFPTNRTTNFHASECSVTFDRDNSTVQWGVGENNHAVERARDTYVAAALFGALDQVKWTRGTGGTITGNDEYHREGSEYGGGANYHTDAFGPVGAEETPRNCRPYTDSKGKRVTRADLDRMGSEQFQRQMDMQRKMAGGGQGRVSKGVKAGGQFTQARRGESGVRLR